MTFHPTMKALVEKAHKHLPEGKKKVIEFGNQRFTAQGFSSTQQFYEHLGYEYKAIDVNENMGAVIADLNIRYHRWTGLDFDPSQYADLVTNNGTSEHLFDQRTCFCNAHHLCKIGGLMIHCLPFHPWINHGFYNYNPILFRDLAIANDYEVILHAIGNRSNYWIECGEWAFVEKRPIDLIKRLEHILPGGEAFFIAIWRRTQEQFHLPFQGKYKKDIQSEDLKKQYV